ncbi:MAG: hypothetical protein ABWZ74_06410 [Hyphomicrobiaceae bacterium]|jgi:hypothetical protein
MAEKRRQARSTPTFDQRCAELADNGRAVAAAIRTEFGAKRCSAEWVQHLRGVAVSGYAGQFLIEAEALGDLAQQYIAARKLPGTWDEVVKDATLELLRKPKPKPVARRRAI